MLCNVGKSLREQVTTEPYREGVVKSLGTKDINTEPRDTF